MAFWPCYSYSDSYTYGSTGNAAGNGLTWSMGTVVPDVPGLDINGVIYRYTAEKDPNADFKVHVYNEDTNGGYVFRETDDWSGLPGMTINKLLSFDNVPISRWGDGGMDTEGDGQITNPSLVYTYRVDPCFDPQSSPSCPGYEDPTQPVFVEPTFDIYNALDDQAVADALKETNPDLYASDDEEEQLDEEDKEEKEDLEKGLAAADNALTLANTVSQEAVLNAMTATVNMSTYYSVTIDGGMYTDQTELKDAQLPENERGLRNGLAQQLLHERMIDMQYNKLTF